MGDFDEDFEAFKTAAEKLMLRRRVKASQLLKRMHDITATASNDLPPMQVLYSGSFSVYDYSAAFKCFLQEKSYLAESLVTRCAVQSLANFGFEKSFNSNEKRTATSLANFDKASRVRDAQWVAPFGQHVMEKWPGIAKLVTAYMQNALGDRMQCIKQIASNEKRLLKILRIRSPIVAQILSKELDNLNYGKKDWRCSSLTEDGPYHLYAPSALEEMLMVLEGEESLLLLETKKTRDALLMHMTEAQYEAMLSFRQLAEKEVKNQGWDLFLDLPVEPRPFKSFSDAIAYYGDQNHALWQHQRLFDESTMRFLFLHPAHTERFAAKGTNTDCTQMFGLCVASTKSCELRITEMPCFSEWTVVEYDGLEKICLVGERPYFCNRTPLSKQVWSKTYDQNAATLSNVKTNKFTKKRGGKTVEVGNSSKT